MNSSKLSEAILIRAGLHLAGVLITSLLVSPNHAIISFLLVMANVLFFFVSALALVRKSGLFSKVQQWGVAYAAVLSTLLAIFSGAVMNVQHHAMLNLVVFAAGAVVLLKRYAVPVVPGLVLLVSPYLLLMSSALGITLALPLLHTPLLGVVAGYLIAKSSQKLLVASVAILAFVVFSYVAYEAYEVQQTAKSLTLR